MKKIFLKLSFIFIITFSFFASCENGESLTDNEIKVESKLNNSDSSSKVKFHLYYATWDSWGRTSKKCKKWGLCQFEDCWACCTDGGVVVNCDDAAAKIPRSGMFIIDSSTNTGVLIIKLDPSYPLQNEAIQNQKTLYVDSDIVGDQAIILKGEYLFDSSIGNNGGYKLNATGI